MTAPLVSATRASVRDAIAQAASRTGVDFGYLLAQAKSESGLDPAAQASTSSAAGLYQFIDQSWLGVVKQHGAEHGLGWAAERISRSGGRWHVDGEARAAVFALRKDPTAAALMAGASAADNADGLQAALGRRPSGTDLYFAHFLGVAGARKFLRAADATPDASAAALFPREAAANTGIFYAKGGAPRSLAQVYQLMGRKLDKAGDAPAVDAPPPPADPQDGAVRMALAQAETGSGGDADTLGFRNLADLLRPDPKHAMLAYRMVAATLG